jgi:hypothetical protein
MEADSAAKARLAAAFSMGRCPECGFAWRSGAWIRRDPETGAESPDPTVPGTQVPCPTCKELRATMPEVERPMDLVIVPQRERTTSRETAGAQEDEQVG